MDELRIMKRNCEFLLQNFKVHRQLVFWTCLPVRLVPHEKDVRFQLSDAARFDHGFSAHLKTKTVHLDVEGFDFVSFQPTVGFVMHDGPGLLVKGLLKSGCLNL